MSPDRIAPLALGNTLAWAPLIRDGQPRCV